MIKFILVNTVGSKMTAAESGQTPSVHGHIHEIFTFHCIKSHLPASTVQRAWCLDYAQSGHNPWEPGVQRSTSASAVMWP